MMGMCYILFEKFPVNYRPVILDNSLKSSYPSSHTILSACVMLTATLQFERLLRGKKRLRRWAESACVILLIVTVMGRVIAGVHWATDILGGMLLALALVELYRSVTEE